MTGFPYQAPPPPPSSDRTILLVGVGLIPVPSWARWVVRGHRHWEFRAALRGDSMFEVFALTEDRAELPVQIELRSHYES